MLSMVAGFIRSRTLSYTYIDCERAISSCRMASSRTSAILSVLLLLVSLVNVTYMLRLYHQQGRADYSKTYPYLGG